MSKKTDKTQNLPAVYKKPSTIFWELCENRSEHHLERENALLREGNTQGNILKRRLNDNNYFAALYEGAGFSQTEIAKVLGISLKTCRHYEDHIEAVPLPTLKKICDLTDTFAVDLVPEDEQIPSLAIMDLILLSYQDIKKARSKLDDQQKQFKE
jgi:DNA-binding XRE family transcriptional regulator